ncbi:MAG: DegQ family serine endoprotease [Deltaproteobacteria bacterium]|nr:DegQ family serine endoprotease [Deltaproteobacteria bacterium]
MNGRAPRLPAGRITAAGLLAALLLGLGDPLPSPLRAAEPPPTSFADIVQEAIPVVVNISTTQTVRRPEIPGGRSGDPMEEFMRRFFDQMPKSYKERSLGSGVIISADGEILTNDHVIGSADAIDVILPDQKRYKAKVVGRDKKTDIALIRIHADHPLPAAKLARGDGLRVGDWVIAIGNPFGLGETVTAGIVSAKGRAIGAGPYDDFIQTDASINPGNSGGPLLNSRGEVVGINSAIYSQSGGNIGIGFAIPIEMAAHIADSLRSSGKVVRGWLGVAIQDVTPELSKALGLPEAGGALVSDVIKDGPADRAGLKRGDVITAYQGKPVSSSRELPIRVADTPVGTHADLTVLRDGQPKTIAAEIGELRDKEVVAEKAAPSFPLGLHVDGLTPEVAERMGIDPDTKGVVVTAVDPGSAAEAAELRPGDVIREVNRKGVATPEAFAKAVSGRSAGKPVLLLVQRDESTLFITISAEEADRQEDAG